MKTFISMPLVRTTVLNMKIPNRFKKTPFKSSSFHLKRKGCPLPLCPRRLRRKRVLQRSLVVGSSRRLSVRGARGVSGSAGGVGEGGSDW